MLALQPDLVVRTYGGGHDIADFMKEPVLVVQIGFPNRLPKCVMRCCGGTELGKPDEAEKLVGDMDRRLKALAERSGPQREVLYMTPQA